MFPSSFEIALPAATARTSLMMKLYRRLTSTCTHAYNNRRPQAHVSGILEKGINTYFENIEGMGSLRENLSLLWAILTSRWYWIILTVASAIVITPFLMIMLVVSLPAPWNFLSTILIVIAWGIVAGYKDWIIAKAKEDQPKIKA